MSTTTTPVKYAVLPDTNVIVAASIRAASAALGIVVTEPHCEESRRLLGALLDQNGRGRCAVSPTVAYEVGRAVWRAAARAARTAFRIPHGKINMSEFPEVARVIDNCVNRPHVPVSSMTRYDPPLPMVEAYLAEVDKMTGEIRRRYGDMAAGTTACFPRGAHGEPVDAATPGVGRDTAESWQSGAAQYKRFLRREPAGNTMDKRILAEAASIRDMICGGRAGPEVLCIASNDMGIFAPLVLRAGRVSRPIVDMIRDRFAITRGFPRDIGMLWRDIRRL